VRHTSWILCREFCGGGRFEVCVPLDQYIRFIIPDFIILLLPVPFHSRAVLPPLAQPPGLEDGPLAQGGVLARHLQPGVQAHARQRAATLARPPLPWHNDRSRPEAVTKPLAVRKLASGSLGSCSTAARDAGWASLWRRK
jgi:hypothetical protein